MIATTIASSQNADKIRSEAKRAEKAGDALRAYLLYSQAAGIDSKDPGSWGRAIALQPQALEAAHLSSQAPKAAGSEFPVPDPADIAAARYLGPPLRLTPHPGIRSFDLRGDSKTLVQQVLNEYGIDVVFDADWQSLPNIRFRITDVAFAEAADALSLATGTFFVPVNHRMAVVARDAPNKRQEIEHTMAVAVPLPTTISVQEAQEMARAVQSIMEVQKFGVDANQRLAVIRDRESKVLPALALFDDLLRHRAQVSVEIELLAATETSDLSFGLRLPTEFPIVAITNNLTLGGGSAVFGLGIANSQLFASMAKGSARSLRRAEVRGMDGQPVTFHVGDRYPVLTSGYYGDTGDAEGTVYRPPPTFNFEDLGVVIKVTPHIHSSSEVTLDVEAEIKFLTGQSLNDIPVISNRSFKMSARLSTAETAVVSGLMSAIEARSITGIAGLAQIPGLGYLFRHEIRSKESGQALLTIRPHLLALPPSEFATRTVYTGTDGRPKIPL